MNTFLKNLVLLGTISLSAQVIYASEPDPVDTLGRELVKQELTTMATQYAVQKFPALAPVVKAYHHAQTARAVVGGCYEPRVIPLTREQEAIAYQQYQESQARISVRKRLPAVAQPAPRSKTPGPMTSANKRRLVNRGARAPVPVRMIPARGTVRNAEYIRRKKQEQLRVRRAQVQRPSEVEETQQAVTTVNQESPVISQDLSEQEGLEQERAESSAAPQIPRIPGVPEDARIVKGPNQRLYAVTPPQFNLGAAPRVLAQLVAMRKIQGAVSSGMARVLPWWLAPVASTFAGPAAYVALNAAYENFIEPRPWVQAARQGLAHVEGFVSEAARPAANRVASWWNWMRGVKPAVAQPRIQAAPVVRPVIAAPATQSVVSRRTHA